MKEKIFTKGLCILSLVLNIIIVPLGALWVIGDLTIGKIRGNTYVGYLEGLKMYLMGCKIGTNLIFKTLRGETDLDGFIELRDDVMEEIEDLIEETDDLEDYMDQIKGLETKYR